MKVKVALENSFMVASLYRQCISAGDGSVEEEKLIGIARVTSDTVFNATLWDVTVDPEYQGEGLGKTLMEMTIRKLLKLDIRTISLFAEPQGAYGDDHNLMSRASTQFRRSGGY